jgi:hypothetical protein
VTFMHTMRVPSPVSLLGKQRLSENVLSAETPREANANVRELVMRIIKQVCVSRQYKGRVP